MDGTPTSLQVQIASGHDSDAGELDKLARGLRGELLALDVQSVERAPATAVPDDAKSGGASLSDLLIVSISNSTVLVAIVHLLQGWIGRGRGRRVTIKLGKNSVEVDAASPEEQAKLIESWIDWHAKHLSRPLAGPGARRPTGLRVAGLASRPCRAGLLGAPPPARHSRIRDQVRDHRYRRILLRPQARDPIYQQRRGTTGVLHRPHRPATLRTLNTQQRVQARSAGSRRLSSPATRWTGRCVSASTTSLTQ
jgi:hypothetical protein